MATSANLYAVNLDEIAQAIIAGGHQAYHHLCRVTMGTGKSSLLNIVIGEYYPSTYACYFDTHHQGSG